MPRRYIDHMVDELEYLNYQRWYTSQINQPSRSHRMPAFHSDLWSHLYGSQFDLNPKGCYHPHHWPNRNPSFSSFDLHFGGKRNDRGGGGGGGRNYRPDRYEKSGSRQYDDAFKVDRGSGVAGSTSFDRRRLVTWNKNADYRRHSPIRQESSDQQRKDPCPSIEQVVDEKIDETAQKTEDNLEESSGESSHPVKPEEEEPAPPKQDVSEMWYSGKDHQDEDGQAPQYKPSVEATEEDSSEYYAQSWFCVEEQQQIVDFLRDVDRKHERQLRYDMSSSKGERHSSAQRSSFESGDTGASLSPSPQGNTAACPQQHETPSTDDEDDDGIIVRLHPEASGEAKQDGSDGLELEGEEGDKSASDYFEEFHDIFTASPEKSIIVKAKEGSRAARNLLGSRPLPDSKGDSAGRQRTTPRSGSEEASKSAETEDDSAGGKPPSQSIVPAEESCKTSLGEDGGEEVTISSDVDSQKPPGHASASCPKVQIEIEIEIKAGMLPNESFVEGREAEPEPDRCKKVQKDVNVSASKTLDKNENKEKVNTLSPKVSQDCTESFSSVSLKRSSKNIVDIENSSPGDDAHIPSTNADANKIDSSLPSIKGIPKTEDTPEALDGRNKPMEGVHCNANPSTSEGERNSLRKSKNAQVKNEDCAPHPMSNVDSSVGLGQRIQRSSTPFQLQNKNISFWKSPAKAHYPIAKPAHSAGMLLDFKHVAFPRRPNVWYPGLFNLQRSQWTKPEVARRADCFGREHPVRENQRFLEMCARSVAQPVNPAVRLQAFSRSSKFVPSNVSKSDTCLAAEPFGKREEFRASRPSLSDTSLPAVRAGYKRINVADLFKSSVSCNVANEAENKENSPKAQCQEAAMATHHLKLMLGIGVKLNSGETSSSGTNHPTEKYSKNVNGQFDTQVSPSEPQVLENGAKISPAGAVNNENMPCGRKCNVNFNQNGRIKNSVKETCSKLLNNSKVTSENVVPKSNEQFEVEAKNKAGNAVERFHHGDKIDCVKQSCEKECNLGPKERRFPNLEPSTQKTEIKSLADPSSISRQNNIILPTKHYSSIPRSESKISTEPNTTSGIAHDSCYYPVGVKKDQASSVLPRYPENSPSKSNRAFTRKKQNRGGRYEKEGETIPKTKNEADYDEKSKKEENVLDSKNKKSSAKTPKKSKASQSEVLVAKQETKHSGRSDEKILKQKVEACSHLQRDDIKQQKNSEEISCKPQMANTKQPRFYSDEVFGKQQNSNTKQLTISSEEASSKPQTVHAKQQKLNSDEVCAKPEAANTKQQPKYSSDQLCSQPKTDSKIFPDDAISQSRSDSAKQQKSKPQKGGLKKSVDSPESDVRPGTKDKAKTRYSDAKPGSEILNEQEYGEVKRSGKLATEFGTPEKISSCEKKLYQCDSCKSKMTETERSDASTNSFDCDSIKQVRFSSKKLRTYHKKQRYGRSRQTLNSEEGIKCELQKYGTSKSETINIDRGQNDMRTHREALKSTFNCDVQQNTINVNDKQADSANDEETSKSIPHSQFIYSQGPVEVKSSYSSSKERLPNPIEKSPSRITLDRDSKNCTRDDFPGSQNRSTQLESATKKKSSQNEKDEAVAVQRAGFQASPDPRAAFAEIGEKENEERPAPVPEKNPPVPKTRDRLRDEMDPAKTGDGIEDRCKPNTQKLAVENKENQRTKSNSLKKENQNQDVYHGELDEETQSNAKPMKSKAVSPTRRDGVRALKDENTKGNESGPSASDVEAVVVSIAAKEKRDMKLIKMREKQRLISEFQSIFEAEKKKRKRKLTSGSGESADKGESGNISFERHVRKVADKKCVSEGKCYEIYEEYARDVKMRNKKRLLRVLESFDEIVNMRRCLN